MKSVIWIIWPTASWKDTVAEYILLTQKHWDEFLAKYLVDNSRGDKLILVWMRQLWQLNRLKKNTNFVLIWVDANPSLRFERILKRNKPWDPKNFNEFLKLEQKDDWESVQKISECMKQVDFLIKNEWNLKQLYEKINEILEKIKNKLKL